MIEKFILVSHKIDWHAVTYLCLNVISY